VRLNVKLRNFIQNFFVDPKFFEVEKPLFLLKPQFFLLLLLDLSVKHYLSSEFLLFSIKLLLNLSLLIKQQQFSLLFFFFCILIVDLQLLFLHLVLLQTLSIIDASLPTSISIAQHSIKTLIVLPLSLVKKHSIG